MRRMAVTLLMLAGAELAWAEPLPGFLNSNDTERRLPSNNLPVDAYRPGAAGLQVPAPASAPQQTLLMSTRVQVRKVRFEGGTVYPLGDLRDHYQPVIGREIPLADLIELTRRLTQRYQDDGYLLSYAYLPPQDFADGRVRVVLVEGYVRDVQVEGDIGSSRAYLDRLLNKLKAERPLTRKTFERYTSLVTRIPGVTFRAEVPPPGTSDGATRLVAVAARKPFTTTLSLNESSRDDLQALLGASSNAQTRYGEQLSANVLVPPGEDKEHYLRVDYSQFIDDEGSRLQLSAARYRSDPRARILLADGTQLSQHRENERYAIGLSQVLIASPNEWFEVLGRFYAVNDRIDYQVANAPLQFDSQTDIRALSFEADWRKAEARRLRILSAGVYQGLDRLGARSNADLDLDFLRLRVAGMQSDNFTEQWQGVASAAGYWSNDRLPDSERAVFGGQTFGRGYPSDQASGDKGWGVAYEINYSLRREGDWVKVLQPYVVLDAARAWFNELDVQKARMSSAAVGLRLGDMRYYNIAVEVAKPMSDIALDSFNRRPRVNLSFSYQL